MSITAIIKSAVTGIIPITCIYAVVNVPVICIHTIPTSFYNQQKLSSIEESISISKKNSIVFKKIYVWGALISGYKYFYPEIMHTNIDYQTSLLTATPNYNTVLNVYLKNIHTIPRYSLHITYDKDTNKIVNKYT
jgi:hypothetical protein